MLFDVRLLAFDDAAVANAPEALVRVFGLDHQAASELLRRLPYVVKRGVNEEGARKLVRALERIGAHSEIVLSGKQPPQPSRPAAKGSARMGALPAPAGAAQALIEARAAREQAAAERARLARASLPNRAPLSHVTSASAHPVHGGHPVHGAHPAARHDAEDDSLEADIGMQARTTPREREARSDRPRRSANASPATPGPRASQAALAIALAQAPARDSRISMQQQPSTSARLKSAAHAPAPVEHNFRISLAQPITPSLATSPQAGAAQASVAQSVSLPRVTPANMQRPVSSPGSLSATNIPVVHQRSALPVLSIHGPPVEAQVCTLPGTKTAVIVAWLSALVLITSLTVLSFGILTVAAVVAGCVAWLSRKRALAAMRASALPVGQSQLPEVYACVKQFTLRLGLMNVPRFYVARAEQQGLRTVRDGRDLIFLIDEATLLGFLESERPQALSFLVAHELCRHVLGHTKWTRRMLARVSPRLACLDLVSADSAATALVLDHAIAKAGLLTLLGAARLHPYLDQDELDRVATSSMREPGFWPTRFGADDGFVLARLYHLQRGYV